MTLTYKKKNKTLSFILLLFTILFTSYVNAKTYCFDKESSLYILRMEIKEFLLEGESVKIMPKEHCLDVTTQPSRSMFVDSLINKKFKVLTSNLEIQARSFCKLKVKEETFSHNNQTVLKIGNPTQTKESAMKKESEKVYDVIGMEGRYINITVDETNLKIICNSNREIYLLDVAIEGSLDTKTTFTTTPGEWLDISSFARSSNKNNDLISTKSGVEIKDTKKKETMKYSIMVVK